MYALFLLWPLSCPSIENCTIRSVIKNYSQNITNLTNFLDIFINFSWGGGLIEIILWKCNDTVTELRKKEWMKETGKRNKIINEGRNKRGKEEYF